MIKKEPAVALTQIIKALSLDDDDEDDFYQWPARRYFLARWEADQLKSQDFNWTAFSRRYGSGRSSDYYSVEHFFPQSPRAKNCQRVHDYKEGLITRRLGNFILIPGGVNTGLSNHPPESKLEKLQKEDARVQGLNVPRLKAFYDAAEAVSEKLVNRELSGFDMSPRSRFNNPTIEQNRSIAFAKTFCDLREEQMIRFALRTWRLDSEMGKDEEFRGVLSFRTDGEAFRADKDDGKHNTNYVISAGNEAPDDKLQTMIFQRNELKECKKLLQ